MRRVPAPLDIGGADHFNDILKQAGRAQQPTLAGGHCGPGLSHPAAQAVELREILIQPQHMAGAVFHFAQIARRQPRGMPDRDPHALIRRSDNKFDHFCGTQLLNAGKRISSA
jgi:hypothetical protein